MVAVAHFPGWLDKGLLERVRTPLAVIAALVLAIDLIGLGLHLADTVDSPFANDAPACVKARIGGPEAVVTGEAPSAQARRSATSRQAANAEPVGCLARSSGCYPGDTAPPAPGSPGAGATPPATPGPQPVPLAQAGVALPALGAQVALGAGDGACTGLALSALAVGDCAAVSGDGPIVLNLGGSLLGD